MYVCMYVCMYVKFTVLKEKEKSCVNFHDNGMINCVWTEKNFTGHVL